MTLRPSDAGTLSFGARTADLARFDLARFDLARFDLERGWIVLIRLIQHWRGGSPGSRWYTPAVPDQTQTIAEACPR